MAKDYENETGWELGRRQHKGRQYREETARELSEDGVADAVIARRLRVSVPTVRKYLVGRVKGETSEQRPLL